MKRILILLMMVALGALARADEQTQAVQQALKEKGFYYGQVDGQGGPETDAAIRRYQIREGLDVTGKMDEQTLDSLHLGGGDDSNTLHAVPPPSGDSAARDTPAPKAVVQSDHDFLKRQPQPAAPAPAPDDEAAPPPGQPQEPPQEPPQPPAGASAGQTLPAEYAQFFKRTPYETAPPEVQRSTVHRAQQRLAHEGFYRGIADGELDDSLGRALVAYQRDAELPPTGRLDMDTLADMDLLPRRHVLIRQPVPVPYNPYYGAPVDGRDVYRGIWVR